MSQQSQKRAALIAALGSEIVRFQDASNAVDDAAAAVLALERADLQCLSMLLFAGPVSLAQLGAGLRLDGRPLRAMLQRLELAGYVRRSGGSVSARIELTDHARHWVQTLWGPLEAEGRRILSLQSTRDLQTMARFMETIRPIQETHAARIRSLLDVSHKGARKNRARGGLSPAAARRVQLFIEANLARPIRIADLAERAGLSEFHFARAFKVSMGMTPLGFLHKQRIDKARELLAGSEFGLAAIAAATGLGSQSRFTTAFRRATGLTPAVFRRGERT